MIPDEAVDAAAKVLLHGWLRYSDPADFAKSILEAAAPHLMAAAWDECEAAKYEIRLNPESNAWEPVKDNPYRPTNV